jgi:hypothetical protein
LLVYFASLSHGELSLPGELSIIVRVVNLHERLEETRHVLLLLLGRSQQGVCFCESFFFDIFFEWTFFTFFFWSGFPLRFLSGFSLKFTFFAVWISFTFCRVDFLQDVFLFLLVDLLQV